MFSSDLDTARNPLSARSWGIVLGSVIMVSVAAALVGARVMPFMFAATVAAFVAAAPLRGKSDLLVPRFGAVSLHLAAFLLYASASAVWAVEPGLALIKTVSAILMMLGSIIVSQLLASETRPNLLHMGEGAWIGLLVALVYFLIEILTYQSIKIWLYNTLAMSPSDLRPTRYFRWSGEQLIWIARNDLTRNVTPITLFLWPAALAMKGTLFGYARMIGTVAIIVLAGVVVMLSPHETSKLAFVTGLAGFGCAVAWPLFTARIAAIGWVCACIVVLPAALLAHRLDLQNAPWLQSTAQTRIVIWSSTAKEALKSPLLGIGANMTYVQGPEMASSPTPDPRDSNSHNLSRHAHNVFLQTWLELGFVGAMLLTMLGLSIVNAIKTLDRSHQPYAYATFASAAAIASASYGMWQTWFMAMFAYCVVLLALGRSVSPVTDVNIRK